MVDESGRSPPGRWQREAVSMRVRRRARLAVQRAGHRIPMPPASSSSALRHSVDVDLPGARDQTRTDLLATGPGEVQVAPGAPAKRSIVGLCLGTGVAVSARRIAHEQW
jgi:hypothetical protein